MTIKKINLGDRNWSKLRKCLNLEKEYIIRREGKLYISKFLLVRQVHEPDNPLHWDFDQGIMRCQMSYTSNVFIDPKIQEIYEINDDKFQTKRMLKK